MPYVVRPPVRKKSPVAASLAAATGALLARGGVRALSLNGAQVAQIQTQEKA